MKIKKLLLAVTAIIAFAMTVTAQTIPSYIPTNGLVGWWPFNGNANDESGNGNIGTVNGATLTSDRNGITSKAYYFNGSNNFIKVLNSQSLSNLKDSLTISGWISSAGTFASLVCKSDILGNDGDFRFFVNDNSTALFSVLGYKFFVLQNAFITANNWMFYAITFTNNTAKLFINGQLVSISNNYNNQQGYNNNSDLFFGRDPWGADEFTKGSLDDIAIYNRALTQTEITALYIGNPPCSTSTSNYNLTIPSSGLPYTWNGLTFNNSGSQTAHLTNASGCDSLATLNLTVNYSIPNYVPTNGLVGYWPFNGNANDESGNGNHGTVNGATLTSDRNGNSGKAYSFACNSIKANVNTTSITSQLTISFWYYRNSQGCFGPRVLEFSSGSNLPGQLMIEENFPSGLRIAHITSAGLNNFLGWMQFNTLTNQTWSNYVYTNNGTAAKIYQNGILINQYNSPGLPLLDGDVAFGWMNHPANDGINGKLDDIAIYNRALTQTEITQLYTNCVATTSTTNLTIPSTSLPYTWNGLTFNASGSQTKHLTNAAGCDSTATLNLTVINTALPSYLPANGLVGWWPFNGNANDESVNGNNGVVNGPILTTDRFGNSNKAYSFDGVNDNINPLQNNLPFGTTARTISIWFQRIGTGGCLFSYGSANTSNAYMIAIGANIIANQGWTSPDFPVYPSIDNLWHNVVCTFDGLNSTIYFDNSNLGSYPMTGLNTIAGSFYFGTRVLNDMDFFNGNIDDIAVWNRQLTPTEITALYSSSQNTIKLNLTAFLQGSKLGNSSMTATLNKVNAAIPNSIADSITVELHASTSPYATMYSSNGVLNTNGTASIAFPNSAIGSSYYIAIKHRNAIETWSAAPVTISNHTIYNFTTAASQAYGNNLSNMGDGVFGMYSGDINQDGSIDFSDYPDLDIANNSGVLGYNVNDLNGDASVDFNDYPLLDINSNNGIIAMRP